MSERHLVASAISAQIDLPGSADALPENIQWMPPGRHTVTPSVGGKPVKMTLDVTPELAAMFNGQLQELRADAKAGVEDEPYIDFNHADDERSGEVTELYWGGTDPKAGGIRARVIWSAAGKAAVQGRNYRRFSPQWVFDKKTFEPLGVTTNLGGLVNRPAFREIAPVVAKDASAANLNKKTKMTDQEIQDAIANGLRAGLTPITNRLAALETGTATARNTNPNNTPVIDAAAIGAAVAAAMKPLTEKFDKAEERATATAAAAALRPHIERGAIAPADTETITFWTQNWIANAKNAESQMAKLPGTKTSARTLTVTTTRDANGAGANAEPEAQIVQAAAKMVEAGNGKVTMSDAIIAAARSAHGQEQYKEFRSTWASKPAANN